MPLNKNTKKSKIHLKYWILCKYNHAIQWLIVCNPIANVYEWMVWIVRVISSAVG